MHPLAAQLIATLELSPHPEGGFFREIHRATSRVAPDDGRAARWSLTVIYFLLVAGNASRWHRVWSDESWHFHAGDALELLVAAPELAAVNVHRVGAVDPHTAPVHVVPAGAWQAARTLGDYTLVSCSVGPGFEFEDFELLRDRPYDADTLRRRHPRAAAWI